MNLSSHSYLLLPIIIIALLYLIKKRPGVLLRLICQSTSGLLFIHFFNIFCQAKGIITSLGINPLTGVISAILGIPGILLLYACNLLR